MLMSGTIAEQKSNLSKDCWDNKNDAVLNNLWDSYLRKYEYARDLSFYNAISSVIRIYNLMKQ